MGLSLRGKWFVVGATCVVAGSLWVGVSQATPQSGSVASSDDSARLFATVAPPDPGIFGTSLEGAAFDSQGHFFFVNTTAPSGQPKLMSLDLNTRAVTDLYTDANSMLNCIGFGPDATMYLCDLKGQKIVKFDPATKQLSDVLTKVGHRPFVPDDIAIDPNGLMYIADYQGTPTAPTGRLLLRTPDGKAQVILTGLSHPNGITLTPAHDSLWIDQDLSNTLGHVAQQFSSPASTSLTVTLHAASFLNLGTNAYTDSLTTDSAGNVYMAVYGAGEVLEFNRDGVQIGRVAFPDSAPRVTHVAIQPGTRNAFVTASGPGGGYIYTFQALAPAAAGAPSGG